MTTIGRLHFVTDHRPGPMIPELVAAAVAGGVDTVQVQVQVRVAGTTGDRQALALTRYLGTGPFRATRTKQGLPAPLGVTGVAGVTGVVTAVQIPVIAIGEIFASDLPTLLAAGAHGAAMVSTFSEAPDPAAGLADLRAALGPAGASPDDVAAARGFQVAAARGLREGAWTSR
jgi:thiamine monophosphate synthase